MCKKACTSAVNPFRWSHAPLLTLFWKDFNAEFSWLSRTRSVTDARCILCFSSINCCVACIGVSGADIVQLKTGVDSLIPFASVVSTENWCRPGSKLA